MQFELTRVNDVFADFNAQLAVVRKENEQTIFDYESKEGNKAARSLIRKLGSSKTAISNAHKDAKSEALEFGRALDSEKKRLTAIIDEMIAVHKVPIKAIEEREKKRIEDIETNINFFTFYTCDENTDKRLFEVKLILKSIEEKEVSESFGEFIEKAELAKFKAVDFLKKKIYTLEEEEFAEKQRLAELAKQQEEARIAQEAKAKKEQEEREAHLVQEAKARAEQEAKEREEQAEKNRIAELERVEREKQQALAKAEQDKKDAIAKIEREKQQAIQAEQKRIADEQARAESERIEAEKKEAKRQANRAHQKRINNTVLEYLKQLGCDEVLGKKIISSIAKQEVPNITINY